MCIVAIPVLARIDGAHAEGNASLADFRNPPIAEMDVPDVPIIDVDETGSPPDATKLQRNHAVADGNPESASRSQPPSSTRDANNNGRCTQMRGYNKRHEKGGCGSRQYKGSFKNVCLPPGRF